MDEIVLSINCITYNHENYIVDAIESFLMQETDFKYEILIHDDASTDKTAKIIREYELRYPDIIKPVYQSENQYSKGKNINLLNQQRAQGKYIATCEGDDFWTDFRKLQQQVEILEADNNLAATFHKVEEITPDKKKKGTYIEVPYSSDNNIYDVQDIIRFDGKKIHFSSLVYRRELLMIDNIPDFFYNSPVGDLPMMLILSTRGRFLYIDKVMSNARRGVPNSASQRLFKEKENFIFTNEKIMEIYNQFNKYTDYVYSNWIEEVLEYREYLNLDKKSDYNRIKFNNFYKKSGISKRMKTWLRYNLPSLHNKLSYIKKQIKTRINL